MGASENWQNYNFGVEYPFKRNTSYVQTRAVNKIQSSNIRWFILGVRQAALSVAHEMW